MSNGDREEDRLIHVGHGIVMIESLEYYMGYISIMCDMHFLVVFILCILVHSLLCFYTIDFISDLLSYIS